MFFMPKKYRDADALKKKFEGLNEKFIAAGKIEDTASRLEALLEARAAAETYATTLFVDCARRGGNIEVSATMGTLVGGVLGGLALVVVNPLIGIPVFVAGIAGGLGLGVSGFLGRKGQAAVERDLMPHLDDLGAALEKAGAQIDDILKTKSTEVAASEKFGSLYDRYPDIRDSFIKTFNQAFARGELPAPPPAANPNPNPPKFAL